MRQPLGQHFLRDPSVIQAILAAAELKRTDVALEIGPGKAVLTEPLAARIRRLVAVELDRELAVSLETRFAKMPYVEIVRGDILKTDLSALFPPDQRSVKILGNLPYAITAPIFEKLLSWPAWDTGVFLIQREVADRLQAPPCTRAFGLLTLAVGIFADAEGIRTVPPGAFAPPPRVHSSVIRLRRKPRAEVPEADVPAFFDFARAAFAHRRKTLGNSVAMATGLPKPAVVEWLASQKIDDSARAEALRLEDYVRIAHPWAIYRREMKLTLPAATSTITEPF